MIYILIIFSYIVDLKLNCFVLNPAYHFSFTKFLLINKLDLELDLEFDSKLKSSSISYK